MKQKDIAMLILVVSISLIAAYLIGNTVFNKESNRTATIEVVKPISPEFPTPDPAVFNERSLNPVETVEIEESDTEQPFIGE